MNRIAVIAMLAALLALPSMISAAQFSIVNAAWGGQNASTGPVAGQHNVPLVITAQNLECMPLKNVTMTLSVWNTGFKAANGQGSMTESLADVGANEQFQYTFYVNVPNNMSSGIYYLPAQITWESASSTSVYLNCTVSASASYHINTPVYLTIPVHFGGSAQLSYRQGPGQLNPGSTGNVTLLVTNIGYGNASQVQTTVSVQSSSKASVVSQPGRIASLVPGQTVPINFTLSIPANFSGSALQLNLSSSFLSGGSSSSTQKGSIGLSVSSKAPIIISQNQTVAGLGGTTQLSIGITNNANSTIYYVQASLGQQQRLASNSSSSLSITKGNPGYYSSIAPGQTVWFTPYVTTSPSASEGGYNTALTVTYTGSGGVSQSLSYNLGIIIAPRLAVVLQGVSASYMGANSPLIQVSGNLLDEGSGNAYYTRVYAYLMDNGSVVASNSTYVGEILTDSPTAFGVVLQAPEQRDARSFNGISGTSPAPGQQGPATVQNGARSLQVRLYASYQDDMGTPFKSNSTAYDIGSGSLFAGLSGSVATGSGAYYRYGASTPWYTYAVVAVIIAAVAVAGFYTYRRRASRRGPKRKERQVT